MAQNDLLKRYLDAGIHFTSLTQGRAEATFDNLELRTSEIPPVGIAQAVQLTWPATGPSGPVAT